MLDLKREDFITYLSELLNISRQTASSKLNGNSDFTEKEISILTLKLGFTADELKNAIIHSEGMTEVESDRMCEATK